MTPTHENVEAYIKSFDGRTQKILEQVRQTIQAAVPEAAESISYAMPAYKLNGKPLVYFAGYKYHIGFYATPAGHKKFAKELSKYKQGKGSVQFPIEEPMPLELIARMVKFKAEEARAKGHKQELKERFDFYNSIWKSETSFSSSIAEITNNSAYRSIIGLGQEVVPFIIDDLKATDNHWFYALEVLTGQNPIKENHKGIVPLMKDDWMEWAKANDLTDEN